MAGNAITLHDRFNYHAADRVAQSMKRGPAAVLGRAEEEGMLPAAAGGRTGR